MASNPTTTQRSQIETYEDTAEYRAAIAEIDTLHEDLELPGCQMGATIETLLDLVDQLETATIITSDPEFPFPKGAEFRAQSFAEIETITNKLGPYAMASFEALEDAARIGFHFD